MLVDNEICIPYLILWMMKKCILSYVDRFSPEKKNCLHIDLPALWHDQNSHTVWHEPWVGSKLDGPFEEGGKLLTGVTKPLGRWLCQVSWTWQACQRCQCLVCRVLTSQDLSHPFWKPPLSHTLGGFSGQVGLPSTHSLFSALVLCH